MKLVYLRATMKSHFNAYQNNAISSETFFLGPTHL